MNIIVSLTSYPLRIEGVHLVIESLYNQTVHADEIILYLSLEEFPKAEENIPESLKRLIGRQGFHIEWVKGNLKSHKKYYYVLQNYREDIVITVDDDMLYAESMISDLLASYRRYPCAISARKARLMLRQEQRLEQYRKWEMNLDEYADMPRLDLCAIGSRGICYPPGVGKEHWFRTEEIVMTAEKQDDLWLKYNELMDGIPTVYAIPSQQDVFTDYARINELKISNMYNHGNDKCANSLMEMMKAKQPDCYERWFRTLMNWEEYTLQKKQYYRAVIKDDFNKAEGMPIYFYGAGAVARNILSELSVLELTNEITAVVVTDKLGNMSEIEGIPVKQFDEVERNQRFAIIFGVNEINKKQIQIILAEYDYQLIEINEQMLTKYINIRNKWKRNFRICAEQ